MDLNTMIVHPNDVLSSLPCYPQDQINMSYSPPEKVNNSLIHNFSFEITKPLKIFRSSLDILFDYLENDSDEQDENNHPNIVHQNHYEKNINKNIENIAFSQKGLEQTNSYYDNNAYNGYNAFNELNNERDITNKYIFMNHNVDIDNNFCDNIIQGNEDQALKLMETYFIDPFKFNQKYQTNPIGLAYLNKHEKIIQAIKNLVYTNQIPYDYNFYCPNWSLKKHYPGFIAYQKKIFESFYQSFVQAFWSDEIKEWVEL